MPWEVISQMDLKKELVNDWNAGCFSITDLSHKYGVSRPTVYKWLSRYELFGTEGLKEKSRAPNSCPHRTSTEILELVVKEKLKNRKRGPRKVRAQLQRKYPDLELPSISAIHNFLKKEGLVESRKLRKRVPPYTEPFSRCNAPNDVWSIDYKGKFPLQNGQVCYPLTISDNYSRYLLGCKALEGPRYVPTRRYIESVFREYGLPDAVRTDNGPPFAGRSIGGLSRLMIWWIQLGIIPERIKKGCPEQNGRHERMHGSLKREALTPPVYDLKEQQIVMDAYKLEYNHNRPHEALNDLTPGDYYERSWRPYVEKPHPPDYSHDFLVRSVHLGGELRFMNRTFFLSGLLAGHRVGLKEIADGLWQIQFSFYALGTLDLRKNKILRN